MGRPAVSVVLPTYNEAKNIPTLIEKLRTTLEQAELDFEIIVVDDNSPDRTWEVAENFERQDRRIRAIRRINERGLSSAVVAGMAAGAGRTFAVMDADMQHDEAVLPDLVRAVDGGDYDVAVGSRDAPGGSYGEFSKRRRFASWVAATMARIMLPIKVGDPMSGYFVISRQVFRDAAEEINPVGFKILLEFIGRKRGLRILELGYKFRLRVHGETKLSGSVIKNYLVALFDLRFGKYISSRFAMYSIVGGTGVLVNLGGYLIGEHLLGLPALDTGMSELLDPLYLSVPFGIQLSIISNYVLNNWITFYEHRHRGWSNIYGIIVFQVVSLLGVLVQWGVMQLLHNNGFMDGLVQEDIRKSLNNMIGIIIAVISNYYLNVNFTWRRR